MNVPVVRRPASAREVAVESQQYSEFGRNVRDFLHEFMFTKQRDELLAPLLAEEPPRLASRFEEGRICDGFLAATADYLSRANHIPTPEWALKEDLMLEKPWFSPDYIEVRLMLLRDTPSAFKDKNIFIFENALSVA